MQIGMTHGTVHLYSESVLYNQPCYRPIIAPIKDQTCTFQCVIAMVYQKYNRRGHESPSGYGALNNKKDMDETHMIDVIFLSFSMHFL